MKTALASLLLLATGCEAQRIVYLDNDAPEPLVMATSEAVERWNETLGLNVWEVRVIRGHRLGYLDPTSVVIVTKDHVSDDPEENAYTLAGGITSRIAVRTETANDPDFPLTWLMSHELGHVMGLDHDSAECNLMQEYWSECDDSANLTLTDKQLRRVRSLLALQTILIP